MEFVFGLNIILNLILKERSSLTAFEHKFKDMTEIELYNELQNVESCLKIADSQISEIRKKKNDIMNDFLSKLPFQEGDKMKDKDGNIFIIEHLKEALSLGKNEIKVRFLIRRIKKNGEPYQFTNEAWGIDYFSLEKVVE